MTALEPVLFESIHVGTEFTPIELIFSRSFILDHAFSLDDFTAFRSTGQQLAVGEDPLDASFLLGAMLRLLNTRFDPHYDRGLHQREEVWFHRAPRLDEPIVLQGRVVDKYFRRGRPYFVVEAEAVSRIDDSVVLRHRATEAVEIGDPERLGAGTAREDTSTTRRVVGDYSPDRTVAPGGKPLELGDCIEGLPKTLTQSQIAVYSNVAAGWRTTHTDVSVAREEGLQSTIAQGLMGACYITELVRAHLDDWDENGHLNVAFIKPMYPGDTLYARGVLTHADDGDIELEVWVENQEGDRTVVGWASTPKWRP